MASAADAWPTHELTMYVNYGPGSATDLVARALAGEMEKAIGQPVIVQNKPGAQGTLGPAFFARRPADGYSFGILSFAPAAIAPHMMDVAYKLDDFDVVAGIGRYRYGVAVRADSPYRTVKDLVDAAKSGKGVSFTATGAPNNLALLKLGTLTGGSFTFVPMKSGPDSVNAVLGSHVDAVVQTPSDIMPFVQSGQMRLLASVSPVRWSELPDTPTMKEAGYNVEIDSWTGIAAPRGLPPEVLRTLEQAALKAVQSPAYQQRVKQFGVDPLAMDARSYRAFLEAGYRDMAKALRDAGMAKAAN
ncbi:tripartite tricarboxylate transporter substrate binding protein [Ramlibacter algicola]|uniref:Tripartite tricarboxylate transporter substrate binding protein n=1 Tax=Ramlibacter algicola TaxID=2795217 RepID=A0A934Q3V1_9BURK|nr:tripartite tricarboxylate transporter substrate binding protein [Ramlibacter algicola]MBK0393764.1 tripartite tricarboxylate transporter substrate binding protein [Ramlibacter algicola]